MHGPSLAVMLFISALGLAASSTGAGPQDVLAEARRKLASDDGIGAVALLEEALPGPAASRPAVLALLPQAYEVAARQALKAGRPRVAETYRENLKILARTSRPSKALPPPTVTLPSATGSSPPPEPMVEASPASTYLPTAPTMLPDGPAPIRDVLDPDPPSRDVPEVPPPTNGPPAVEPPRAPATVDPSALPPTPAPSPAPDLSTADAAFSSKDYREAGRIYDALARARQLPPERRGPWLYCRAFEVVGRINARPTTQPEWASINAEIGRIRALEKDLNVESERARSTDPRFYLGEYLHNLAADRQDDRTKSRPSTKMVVRASAPEEPPAVARPARQAPNPAPPQPVPPTAPARPATASRVAAGAGRWQIHDSANFRVYHLDPALGAGVARAAEAARLVQMNRWHGQAPQGAWSPPCEIYLYPGAKQYAQMTGQPEDSPGFSTMGMNAGRIISRRVNLRTDHPSMVEAVLPHEITHVILADFFAEQQIPRWADEGLAVLAEPVAEQRRRAADLVDPLAANRLFMVDVLMNMDYPDDRYWSLYYAQSVSLTRFLVEQGTPARMLEFLQDSQREGYEAALRRVYQIEGFSDLQRRWLAYARSQVQSLATAKASATGPDLKVR